LINQTAVRAIRASSRSFPNLRFSWAQRYHAKSHDLDEYPTCKIENLLDEKPDEYSKEIFHKAMLLAAALAQDIDPLRPGNVPVPINETNGFPQISGSLLRLFVSIL
jgi:hypothetical protein